MVCAMVVGTTVAQEFDVYGTRFNVANVQSTDMVPVLMENKDSLDVILKGTIVETCAVKGCWMTMQLPNGEEMRVQFKDYGFFVPKEGVEGKTAVINGRLKKTVTDVATLRHFAEDAGKSPEEIEAITEPRDEITFLADGVLIMK